jgi:hypothetical protein
VGDNSTGIGSNEWIVWDQLLFLVALGWWSDRPTGIKESSWDCGYLTLFVDIWKSETSDGKGKVLTNEILDGDSRS